MSDHSKHRLLRPESLTALGIIVVAGALLAMAFQLRPISALLPAAMLIGLIGLSAVLLIADQRHAVQGQEPVRVVGAPKRVFGAFLLIIAYALAVDFLGFYPSTAVAIPLVAWLFGYRNPLGLALAAVIVLGAVYLIFDLGMHRGFPTGRLWES